MLGPEEGESSWGNNPTWHPGSLPVTVPIRDLACLCLGKPLPGTPHGDPRLTSSLGRGATSRHGDKTQGRASGPRDEGQYLGIPPQLHSLCSRSGWALPRGSGQRLGRRFPHWSAPPPTSSAALPSGTCSLGRRGSSPSAPQRPERRNCPWWRRCPRSSRTPDLGLQADNGLHLPLGWCVPVNCPKGSSTLRLLPGKQNPTHQRPLGNSSHSCVR